MNLLKNTSEYRIDSKEEVDKFHKECEEEARNNGYVLSAWTETFKETKVKGEVVDEFYVVKVTFIFNTAKEIILPYTGVEFTEKESVPF